MLPDLRIVIAAVISTFVLTVGVGFYTSSRLISEPKRSTDSLIALEETPVNRIALSWPEPARQPEPLALDFAVSTKALRNPVRDVTNDSASSEQWPRPVRTTSTDVAVPSIETPAQPVPEKIELAPAPVMTEVPESAPEPEIRVAVQYPPVLELPPELQTPVIAITPAAELTPPITEAPATTGSISDQPKTEQIKTEQPKSAEPVIAAEPAPPVAAEPDVKIASLPEPTEAGPAFFSKLKRVPLPKPAPKVRATKAAPKKAAPAKRQKTIRRTAAPAVSTAAATAFPWNIFGTVRPN